MADLLNTALSQFGSGFLDSFSANRISANRFKAEAFSKAGIARQSLFLVQIHVPGKVLGSNSTKMLSLFCDSTFLPGISIGSMDNIRRYGYGPAPRMPYGVFFGDLQNSFMVDGQGKILKIFQDWTKYIVNYDDSHGMTTETQGGASPYEVNYKDDYAARIEIIVFDERAHEFVTYTLEEAYPSSLSDIQMNWADENSIARLQVTFNYRSWSVSRGTDTSSEIFGMFNSFISKSGAGSTNDLVRNTLNIVNNSFGI